MIPLWLAAREDSEAARLPEFLSRVPGFEIVGSPASGPRCFCCQAPEFVS